MKAIGYQACLPIQDPSSLVDIDLPVPVPGPRDLLVEVEAISVNPVDTKIRQRAAPPPANTGSWAGTPPDAFRPWAPR